MLELLELEKLVKALLTQLRMFTSFIVLNSVCSTFLNCVIKETKSYSTPLNVMFPPLKLEKLHCLAQK